MGVLTRLSTQASVTKNDENQLVIRGDLEVADAYALEFWRVSWFGTMRDPQRSVTAIKQTATSHFHLFVAGRTFPPRTLCVGVSLLIVCVSLAV